MHPAPFLIVLPFLAGLVGIFGQVNTSTISADCVKGNGHPLTEQRTVGGFDTLDIDGSFDVNVVCQQSPSLTIVAESNLLPYIVTEIIGATLKVSARKSICANNPIILSLSTKQLAHLKASGSNDITVKKLAVPHFDLTLEGAGDVTLQGKSDRFSASIDGSSDIRARDLQASDVEMSIQGASSAEVYASKRLHVLSQGASDVCYHGNPASVSREILGVGDVEPCQ